MRRITCTIAGLALIVVFTASCGNRESKSGRADTESSAAKITFLELGSVTCIPCKQMQPVMKAIETKYKGQVKVVFHDVMKDKAPAQKYGIKLIPTQIFLDAKGTELMRHEGFFAEAEIDKFLKTQGVNPVN